MRPDFAAFILTHGRPDRVYTYDTLRKAGYTGQIYIVIDNEDKKAQEYRDRYGAEVLQFDKAGIAATFDEGDNFGDRRAIVYARNACFELARQVGARFFIQLDDDYRMGFFLRFNAALRYGNTPKIKASLDEILTIMLEFQQSTPALTVAMSQGGDHIGGNSGGEQVPRLKRKAMNSFICDVERPFTFVGRINEDVNTYTAEARRGALFLTVMQVQVNQPVTQSNAGGMSDLYLDSGTYVKSFYSVMYCPSSVKIGQLGDPRSPHFRIHHKIDWPKTAACILREEWKKGPRLVVAPTPLPR